MFSSPSPSHGVEFKTESIHSRTIELWTWRLGDRKRKQRCRYRSYESIARNLIRIRANRSNLVSVYIAIRLRPRFFQIGKRKRKNNYRIQKSGGKVWNLFKCKERNDGWKSARRGKRNWFLYTLVKKMEEKGSRNVLSAFRTYQTEYPFAKRTFFEQSFSLDSSIIKKKEKEKIEKERRIKTEEEHNP